MTLSIAVARDEPETALPHRVDLLRPDHHHRRVLDPLRELLLRRAQELIERHVDEAGDSRAWACFLRAVRSGRNVPPTREPKRLPSRAMSMSTEAPGCRAAIPTGVIVGSAAAAGRTRISLEAC